MKNTINKVLFGAFVVSTIVWGLTAYTSNAVQGSPNQGVSGQGSLPAITSSGDTRKRQFSVNAHQQADGTVKGNAVLHNPAFTVANGQKYQLQVDISCMKVVGNIAVLGGTTKRTNDPNLVDAVYFTVQDNGEPGKGVDKISRAYFYDDDPTTTGDPQACQNTGVNDFPLETIESGNIQVR